MADVAINEVAVLTSYDADQDVYTMTVGPETHQCPGQVLRDAATGANWSVDLLVYNIGIALNMLGTNENDSGAVCDDINARPFRREGADVDVTATYENGQGEDLYTLAVGPETFQVAGDVLREATKGHSKSLERLAENVGQRLAAPPLDLDDSGAVIARIHAHTFKH